MAVTSTDQELEGEVIEVEKDNKKSRSKCPGVRVLHGRIYDSDNGKTCHQCRQKTRDFTAECKNMKGVNRCTIKYCHKCLLNRYGEKAEEVALLDNWTCPKCKEVCNCSFCRKKRGHKPTGILVRTAKVNGFSSVSEMLQIKGPENFGYDRTVKAYDASSDKLAHVEEELVASPRKSGKENFTNDLHSKDEGNSERKDSNVSLGVSIKKKSRLAVDEKISTKKAKVNGKNEGSLVDESENKTDSNSMLKQEASKNEKKHSQDVLKKEAIKNAEAECEKVKTETSMSKGVIFGLAASEKRHAVNKSMIKTQSEKIPKKEMTKFEKFVDVNAVEKKSKKQSQDVSKKETIKNVKDESKKEETQMSRDIADPTVNETRDDVDCKINNKIIDLQIKHIEETVPLPSGTCLTAVAGIELPHEDAGHALQFVEFCAAFGEVFDIKKGQVEAVIREILFGRRGRRSQSSLLVQFHIKLSSLILEDMGEESPVVTSSNGQHLWLKALDRCVSNSKFMSKEFPSDCFDGGNERYDMLSTSQKLKLLNFLCDEALNTNDLRSWIDGQHSKFVENEKEAKEKVLAAKNKEKSLKQKVQDEVAKAIIAKNGAPFSISEHDAIVSQIKKEAAQAHAEMLAAMGMVPQKRKRSDAVRTDPIFQDANGHVFWRLKGYSGEPDILLQDIGNWDLIDPEEKWFVYNSEQKQGVEKYISSLRTKKIRAQKVGEIPSFGPCFM
ncbi:uncharacterized protein LOC126679550 [Mercurialis annua]|uniref:uncharacterized protein LOC126679550 n=1 Tax=Mercurialis annua TaxID=3986 RepID=UPI00215E82F7|nr:uncharacterized protein LOC126679550 [Mercurialis annua]